ncbi:MAG TPA: DUF433 domain-containing protein [Verrucomicrobiae bacterium]|nr:DUF433 domain-containing protein [Verrucomicrobiae bacterium]
MKDQPNSAQLALLRELVVCDPETMRGTPVFQGTRIPVDLVAEMLGQHGERRPVHPRSIRSGTG